MRPSGPASCLDREIMDRFGARPGAAGAVKLLALARRQLRRAEAGAERQPGGPEAPVDGEAAVPRLDQCSGMASGLFQTRHEDIVAQLEQAAEPRRRRPA